MTSEVKETKEFLESKLNGFKPDLAVILGTGFGGIGDKLTKPVAMPFAEVPHFPKLSVSGHAGQLIFGELAGKKLLVLSGRGHYYEGRPLPEVTYPVDALSALGIKLMLVTCAAGGINPQYKPGDLMLIEDHINFMGVNPLIGRNGNGGIKFVDMTNAYAARLREKMETAAEKLEIHVWKGTYLATSGPNYETPAEIKAFAWLGADAVGMSTVPEVILARYHNLEVAGICCISNLAAGVSSKKLTHEDALAVGKQAEEKLIRLLTEFIGML